MGLEATAENIQVEIPDWTLKPLWEKKFKVWKNFIQKGCPAKTGLRGHFCSWGGHVCYYNGCPRRIFEEVAVVQEAIPQPVPTPDFVAGFKAMEKQVAQMRKQLNKANARIKELEEKEN